MRGRSAEGSVMKILDDLSEQVLAGGEEGIEMLERMALHLRERARDARGTYPEACTAYDDRVEEILTVMVR